MNCSVRVLYFAVSVEVLSAMEVFRRFESARGELMSCIVLVIKTEISNPAPCHFMD